MPWLRFNKGDRRLVDLPKPPIPELAKNEQVIYLPAADYLSIEMFKVKFNHILNQRTKVAFLFSLIDSHESEKDRLGNYITSARENQLILNTTLK
jgi:hypothetical protein